MENQKNKLTEEVKLMEEKKRLMEAVNSDPHVANSPLPPNMLDKVYKEIRANEAERAIRAIDAELMKAGVPLEEDVDEEEEEIGASEAKADAGREFSEEDKELIRLGKIYRKRKKLHRYLVAAAAIVGVLAFGITSMGGPKKVFEKFERNVLGREQNGIDSDDNTKFVETIDEEEVYQEIEDKYGFTPVKPVYRPEGVVLLGTTIGDEIQGIHMNYGIGDEVSLSYFIRPNYREGSYGTDMEDEVIDEYYLENGELSINVKQYRLEDGNVKRWSAEFSYNDVNYFLVAMDMEKQEFEKILKNLFFL